MRVHNLLKRPAICLLFWTLWSGCEPESWDLGAPEVVEISEYTLKTEPFQGTAEHGVEEVWVYSATDVLGVYPLPAKVALPAGEPQTLTLLPGFRANGVAAIRRVYPFYEAKEVVIDGDPSTLEQHTFEGRYVEGRPQHQRHFGGKLRHGQPFRGKRQQQRGGSTHHGSGSSV